MLEAVQEREAGGSTGIGFGVAIPHARAAGVPELSLVCGVSPSPVPFDSIDGEPVRLFFLIVGPRGVRRPAREGPRTDRQAGAARGRAPAAVRRGNPDEFYNALLDAEAR